MTDHQISQNPLSLISYPAPRHADILLTTSGTLYLFTFLITIIVLALISGALLFRAYYVRRRFQRRVEEAIRNGRPLPTDAAIALGLMRPGRPGKKEKKLGPMPMIWETEMLIEKDGEKQGDDERDVGMGVGMGRDRIRAAGDWSDITVCPFIIHIPGCCGIGGEWKGNPTLSVPLPDHSPGIKFQAYRI